MGISISVSRKTVMWGLVVVLSIIAVILALVPKGQATGPSAAFATVTPMSAEEWSKLFINAPGERMLGDGSTVLTGRATWVKHGNGTEEISLHTREGNNYALVVPADAYVYRGDEFFSAGYPQPTVESPSTVLAQLRDTPVMIRVKDNRVTTVFILTEVEQ